MEMRVYEDFTSYQPKPMFGLTWRQLAAVALGGPIALAVFFGVTWIILLTNGWEYGGAGDLISMSNSDSELMQRATTIALFPTFAIFIPFAIYGWLRPKGLKPERHLPYWYDYMRSPKELCYGTDAYDRGRRREPVRGRGGRPEPVAGRSGGRLSRAERRRERQARRYVPSEHAAPSVPAEPEA